MATHVLFGAEITYDPNKNKVHFREKKVLLGQDAEQGVRDLVRRIRNSVSLAPEEIQAQLDASDWYDRVKSESVFEYPNRLEMTAWNDSGDGENSITGRQFRKFNGLDDFDQIVEEMIDALLRGEDNYDEELR